MADLPLSGFNNKTPLMLANTASMDYIASRGVVGLVKTVPDGMPPGSDVANLSVLGFDPEAVYSGRSPLEAASIGVDMKDGDVSFRANLVTLSDDARYRDKIMLDYSADEIPTEQAHILINALNDNFSDNEICFYGGVSYRHLLLWQGADFRIAGVEPIRCTKFKLTPPHDISGKKIADYLPDNATLLSMMEKSNALLSTHPLNLERVRKGRRPANSIWIWGEGTRPDLPSFYEKYHLNASVISAVDLVKGIACLAKMRSVEVEGATGNIHTNFAGKAKAAMDQLAAGQDLVYLHIEAADECGHRFEVENKIKAIEYIDKLVVKLVFEYLTNCGEDFKILILPDHPTPAELGTHTRAPVPFAVYNSTAKMASSRTYDEACAANSGLFIENGYTLMDMFINNF